MQSAGFWGSALRHGAVVAALSFPGFAAALETTLTAPGAPDELVERMQAAASVFSAEGRGLDTSQELLAAARSDYRTLVQVLYDEGYFSPVINIRVDGREAANIAPLEVPQSINAIAIQVQTGPAFKLGQAIVAPLAEGTALPEGFRSGAPANTGLIRDAAIAGIDGWRAIGYAKTKVDRQTVTINHPASVVNADIELDTGPKLRFGKITVRGNEDVRTEAILAIAGFPTGEVYSPKSVRKVGSRLRRTGAFASVALTEAKIPNADGTLDFGATVTEQVPRRITLGGEVASNTGVNLSAIWLHRNFFGNAERLKFEAQIRNIGGTEDIDGLLSIRLDRPAALGPDDGVFYLAELEQLNETHFSVLRAQIGMGVRRVYSDQLFAELAVAASVSDADDAFGDDRRFTLLSFPGRVELDMRDDPINAKSGYYFDARVIPFAGFNESASGVSAYADGRGYLSVTQSGSIVLAGRLQLGSVFGASQSEITPEYLFYSGGAGTVRGQPYQSLGVAVGNDIAGGRSLLAASAEIRGEVTEKISLVGFYDFGAVDASGFITGDSETHAGAGLGIRYDLGGFGPLRFDLAYPVSGDTSDGLQFYLGIGQAF